MRSLVAVTRAPEKPFSLEYVDLPRPAEDEILVKIAAVGVCHTDLSCWDQVIPVTLPAILGHEGAGIVEQVGSHVAKVKSGDHVVLTGYSCGTCPSCLNARPTYCTQFEPYNFGFNPALRRMVAGAQGEAIHRSFFGQSSFAQYSLARERSVVKVPKDVPIKILGPLGCGIMSGAGTVICGLKPQAGSTIAIFGTGSLGLSSVLAAVLSGCSKIIAVDVMQSRLDKALAFGATHVINGKQCDAVQEIRKIVPGGVNFAVDYTANLSVIKNAVGALAPCGTMGIVGGRGPQDDLAVNYVQVMSQGISVRGFLLGNCVPEIFIPQLIDLYTQGRFPFDKMISFYPFDQINQAIADQLAGKIIKPVLELP